MSDFILYVAIRVITLFIIWYVVVLYGLGLVRMVLALFIIPGHIKKTKRRESTQMAASANSLPISLLVPVYNEADTIVESVKSMLNMNYDNFEVIVINDGSTDASLQAIVEAFGLHKISYPVRDRLAAKRVRDYYANLDIPRLRLIDKERGGKSDALNAGVNLSRYPYIMQVNAGAIMEPDGLFPIASAFMHDKYTVAVAGATRVANGCTVADGSIQKAALPKKIWPLFQTLEYFRIFLAGRMGWNRVNSLFINNGAFGAFHKEPILAVGGFTTGTEGEDTDMLIKLHRYMHSRKYKYRICFVSEPVCQVRAPESFRGLYRQRKAWQLRLMDTLGRSRALFMNPRYGWLGMAAIPYYFAFEMLAPVVELLGYILIPLAWYFGYLSFNFMGLFYIAAVLFGVVTSIGSLAA